MGTTLTGTTPQDTYDSLIKVTDNGPLSGTLKALSDGLGNDSTLSLSTTAASIAGTLSVTGNATFDTSTLFVDASANQVGVGTATPKGKLDVIHGLTSPVGLGDVDIDALRLEGGGITAIRSAQYDSINQPAAGDIQFLNLFFNGSSYNYYERMRVTAVGNVGIGTSSPNAPIQINGAPLESSPARATIRTFDTSSPAANVGAGLMLGYQFNTGQFVDGACIQAVKENGTLGNYATSLAFFNRADGVGFTEKVRILSSGGITFNGDTAAANALDDYEEGTWTMGVSFGGASVGTTYSINTGTYTKIGRQVTVNGYLIFTNKGSSTGDAQLTGLPFAIGVSEANRSVPSLRFERITFANQFQGFGSINSTTIVLQETTELGIDSNLTDADFANNSRIMISFTYFV